MSEELTAEERALVCGGDADRSIKLLRLYDAALARVPLAQKCDNYRTALDAWNDEITARIKAQGELSTALARIAELEAENDGYIKALLELNRGCAKAVEELVALPSSELTDGERALEALR